MNDRAWAIAFAANIVVTVVSAWHFRDMASTALTHILRSRGWDLYNSDSEGDRTLVVCLLLIPLAQVASLNMLHALASCSKRILQVTFVVFVLVSCTMVFLVCSSGAVRGAVALAAVYAVIAHVFILRRIRINAAAANLKVAATVVKATPQMASWALFMSTVRAAWLTAGAVALLGSIIAFQTVHASDGTTYRAVDCHSDYSRMTCECNGNIVSDDLVCKHSDPNLALVCVWSVSVLWGSVISVRVVAATMAESVGPWSTSPGRVEPVWKSFYRVIYGPLGSLCKAVGIEEFLLSMQFVFKRLSNVFSVIRCPSVCVRRVVRIIWEHTVCFISVCRVNFSEAARCSASIFLTHGLTRVHAEALVVVSVGGTLLSLAVLTIVIFGIMIQGASSLAPSSLPNPVVVVVYSAFVVTIVTTFETVMCAFKTVFATFLQDPEAFAAKHGRWLQDDICRSWQQLKLLHSATEDVHVGVHA